LPVLRDHQAATQAVGRAQRDGAHHAVAELLLHFERQRRAVELQRVVHRGIWSRGNSTSTTAPMHWTILPWAMVAMSSFEFGFRVRDQTAAAPLTISESSLVIAAWRVLL
jgi:hypothetical protein